MLIELRKLSGSQSPQNRPLLRREQYAIKSALPQVAGPLVVLSSIEIHKRRGLVNPEQVITHRFSLRDIHRAVEAMGSPNRNKVIVNP